MPTPYLPFDVANPLIDDPPRLRAAMEDRGYLFFKNVAPREKLLEVRRDIIAILREVGWVAPSADPLEAGWSGVGPFTEGEPDYMAVYKRVLYLPSFDALPEDPRLKSLVGRVTGEPVQVHRLRIARIVFPRNVEQTIAAHQDYFYIGGTPAAYTLWMPLGDCPPELGGLGVLEGSHKHGFQEHEVIPAKKVANRGLPAERLPSGTWRASPFELGDALMFHSHTIHQALPNHTPNRMRLSVDDRYQREGEAIAAHSLKRHYGL